MKSTNTLLMFGVVCAALFAATVTLEPPPQVDVNPSASAFANQPGDAPHDKIDFDRQIKPILSDRCYLCHGPDSGTREADLRLDLKDEAFAVIEPGDPENSELIARVFSDDEYEVMPPRESNLTLSSEEKVLLKRWIEQGAQWKKHWAFERPQKSPLPPATSFGGSWEAVEANPVDRFVGKAISDRGWKPEPQATREKLLRRLSFDLTGLPPSLEELDAFLNDTRDNAYEIVVDRLLASPRFGERMASDWLDAARYSDTYGYQVDRDRFVWPWRDWLVKAINDNLPYDQFLTQQLAGDLLPEATDATRIATTFNRLHPQKVEGGSVPEEFRVEYVADRAQTVSTAMLGLTFECARCHDHKYDPISQKEYFQLFSFFNNINEAGLYSYFTNSVPSPSLLLMNDEQKSTHARLIRAVESAEETLSELAVTERVRFEKQRSGVTIPNVDPNAKVGPNTVQESGAQDDSIKVHSVDFAAVKLAGNKRIEEGDDRGAILFSGDDELKLSFGNFKRFQPFSIATRIKVPDLKKRAVVLHRSRAWTDAGSRGYEFVIEDGRATFSLVHFLPGNAIGIKSLEPLPTGAWVDVVMTYDGSSRANGLSIYVDGKLQKTEVICDNLVKQITGGGQNNLALGARFRDNGFAAGQMSKLSVFEVCLTEAEAKQALSTAFKENEFTAKLPELETDYLTWLNRESQVYIDELDRLRLARMALAQFLDRQSEMMVMEEMPEPRKAFVLNRGLYDQPGEEVSANVPEVLPPLWGELGNDDSNSGKSKGDEPNSDEPANLNSDPMQREANRKANRLALAKWMTRADHPLTARVAVNRFWKIIFGRGIVSTPEDFGRQGALPTHPELLDWLAVDFIENGWDTKRLIKQMVMSATYQQAARTSGEKYRADPENEWLARGSSFRLDSEMLRDNALAVSGLLVDKLGGGPVKPYDLDASFKPVQPSTGESLYRRSLYTYWKRTAPSPVMMALDAAKRDVCRVKRERTASPLQSLVLLNGPQFVEASRVMAFRLMESVGFENSDAINAELVDRAFRKLTSRLPDERERSVLLKLLKQQQNWFGQHQDEVTEFLSIGEAKVELENVDPVNLAAWTTVVNTLFNHDECVTRR